ncbi:methionine aminopeptidase [Ktedonobacter sp. SOSP1-85]|uniref:type I methionyl aminopeptidase n=1 Tax=Ktedonobacter sp. SOSP1-85 TaxID=2778367 RepID=UPI001915741C|nr:type I methionyl aminopeptidase [Ktedonobacter sp. SOSP1-85]GHO72920.1 methionine aminopeptidase [Ktedonobacter sp. SOSP1-85]
MAVMMKSRQEIAKLREAGRLVAQTFEVMRPYVKPGVTTLELDQIAEDYIRGKGALPIYKGYGARPAYNGHPAIPAFPGTICISINEVVCHGIPSAEVKLKEGDIVGVDIGVLLNGWVGDSCVTYAVGEIDEEAQKLMEVAKRCTELGIAEARHNKRLGDVGAAIQEYAESNGFSTVRELGGHGVGRSLHEDPHVSHFGKHGTGLRIRQGMVFTVEPMINVGTAKTRVLADQWTVCTADGKRSAQFEHTLAVTDGAPELLTIL